MKSSGFALLYSIVFTLLIALIVGCATGKKETVFYVSLSGSDSWSGKLAEPNKNGTDGPFASLERARDAVKELKKAGKLPAGGVTVFIRGGVYPVKETFKLTAEDSGAETAPVVWLAYPGEEAHFTGGKVIGGFGPVALSTVSARFDPAFRDSILQTDLKAQGIEDLGEIKGDGPEMELFFRGRRMTLARYPNSEWLLIADVPQTGKKLFFEGTSHTVRYGVHVGRHFGRFTYDDDRPKRWRMTDDMWMHGYWTWDWSDSFHRIQSIDTKTRTIYPAEPHHNSGYSKKQRYYFVNILEELDSPGEWYLDRTSGILYFWPPAPIGENDASVSVFSEALISLEETSYVTVRGVIFEVSRAGAVEVKGGTHNTIAGCTFRYLRSEPVVINGGTENGVTGCDIYDVGAGGIVLQGGDRKTLTPGNNFATNNHIYNYSVMKRTNRVAVSVQGVGNLLAHNYIHNAPHAGVFFGGNENILEYNEVHDIALETGDVGAFYNGRDWTMRGNIIRYNFFHHLQGPGLHGVRAVYLDDWASGTTVFGNIFYKVGRSGVHIGGGRDNTVENNIFVECNPSVHVDGRGLYWAKYYFDKSRPDYTNDLFDKMDAMNYSQPPYSEKYPELLKLYDDEPAVPKGNKILRNVSAGNMWMDLYDFGGLDLSVIAIENNLIADPVICYWRMKDVMPSGEFYMGHTHPEVFTTYKNGDPVIAEKLKGNTIIFGDPGFVDPSNENFQLKDDSQAYTLGFQRIPAEKIGLYVDEYRAVLPERK